MDSPMLDRLKALFSAAETKASRVHEGRIANALVHRRQHRMRKYNPSQPRVPAGSSDGGQWTREGGAGRKSADENYGVRGTTRIDVLENTRTGIVCVYDIKTGRSGLTGSRMLELASAVSHYYPDTRWIIVTEVRPSRAE